MFELLVQTAMDSLLTARLHRLDFYVVLRKLIAELQAFSQCIQETPMVRFYSSIYADDKMLIRQMSCDSAFHGIPHQIAAAHRMKTECLGSVPDGCNAMIFEARVAEMPPHQAVFATSFLVAESLEYRPDQ
jgi:hypothetical protein